jgi:ArsR family transcriptional regulator, arsenate/arsenite/antimonite-responsive transcriptional repressor
VYLLLPLSNPIASNIIKPSAMPPPTLTPDQFNRITKALADPTRYEMLRRIFAQNCDQSKDMNCGDCVHDLPISPATGSHHLRELELADLISVAKDGRFKILTPRRDIWSAYLAQLHAI